MRIGLDLDGVICATPFGRLAVRAPAPVPDLPPGYEQLYAKTDPLAFLRWPSEYLRFGWRSPVEGAREVLGELSGAHELYVVTGRSRAGEAIIRRWLRRNRLDAYFAEVRMAPPGLRPAQHKLAVARMLGIDAHIDDDPRTAFHLARNGVHRVFLFAHEGGEGALGGEPLPAALTIVRSLRAFATALQA
ncbi:MAG: hypothetical protein WEC75_01010 [Dehalococcoidia bacterium]